MAWDDVDLLGYDGLGDPTGLPAIYGAMIGAGVATAAEIGVNQFWPAQKLAGNAELIGLGAGLAAAGAMIVFPETRHAGWTAGAVALISNGLRAAEKKFGSAAAAAPGTPNQNGVRIQNLPRQAAGAIPGVAGLGAVRAQALNGLSGNGGVKLLGQNARSMSSNYGTSYAR